MMKRRVPLKLKTILVIFATGLIVCTLGLSGIFSFSMFQKLMVEKISNSRVDVLSQISEKLTTVKLNAEMLSNLYFYNSNFTKNYDRSVFTEEERAEIEANFKELEGMSGMTEATTGLKFYYELILNNGYAYSSLDDQMFYHSKIAEYRNSMWFRELQKTGNIWTPTYEDAYGNNIISNVRSIKDSKGDVIGIFMFNIYEENIRRQFMDLIDENDIYIIDNEGNIISHMDEEMIGIRFYDMDVMNNMFEEKNYNIVNKNRKDYLFSIYKNHEGGWIVVEEILMALLLEDVRRIKLRMVQAGFLLFLVGIIISIYIAQKTTRPLRELVGELEQVANSERDNHSFNVTGWYEISKISNECNYMNERIRLLVDKIKESEKRKRVAEMGFMQSQMSPHFLYNTLFSIRCLVDMEDKKGAIGIIDAFTSILKYILSYKSEFVDVAQEIRFLEDYAVLQKYRYGDQFELVIHCSEELYSKKILRMILEPLVENSVFHGMDDDVDSIRVEVEFRIDDSDMFITVTDNGVGFTNKKFTELSEKMRENNHSNMIGMNNIRERIKMNFGKNYTLSIDTLYEQGARVIVKVPIIE